MKVVIIGIIISYEKAGKTVYEMWIIKVIIINEILSAAEVMDYEDTDFCVEKRPFIAIPNFLKRIMTKNKKMSEREKEEYFQRMWCWIWGDSLCWFLW